MKKIIVGSRNQVKVDAARIGFERMFPAETFITEGISVPSGVREQPMTDQETFQGSLQRARAAKEAEPRADYWAGIEGGLEEIQGEMQVFAWVVILSRDSLGKAKSGTFILPPGISALVRSGMELGHADDKFFGRSNSKTDNGSVGILTDDAITRRDYYIHPVMLALIPFLKAGLYSIY